MRSSILTVLFIFTLFLCMSCQDEASMRDNTQKVSALQALKVQLHAAEGWEKVNAAEFLLDLGYREDISELFSRENRNAGRSTSYFVGVWRVLARVDEVNKQKWVDSIGSIFYDKSSPYREHAIESLAKLNLKEDKYYTAFAADTSISGNLKTRVFAWWSAAHSRQYVDSLFLTAADQSAEPGLRKRALYALKHIRTLSDEQWKQLSALVLGRGDADVKPDLLMAAYVNSPKSQQATQTVSKLKKGLEAILAGSSASSGDAALALSEFGDRSGLELITGFQDRLSSASIAAQDRKTDISLNYAVLKIHSMNNKSLGAADWLVIAVYLGGMLLIGWYYSNKNRSSEDYTLGGRNMNPIAVGISLFATLLSTLSYLSYPGEMVKYGPVIFTGMFAFPLVYWAVGWWIIPKIMKMNVTSAYELLEIRLGLNVRMLAVFFFLFLRILWMATIMYVTIDVALFSIVPLDKSLAPLFGLVMLLITIIYTGMGGIKAVVITDVVQSIILISGTVLCVAYVMFDFGSLTAWLPDQWFGHWSTFKIGFNTTERLTVGNAVITLFLWYICTAGGDQTAIQRYLSTRDVKAARKTLGVSLITNLAAKILLALVGLALLAYFTKNGHMLKYGQTLQEQADVLFPHFILVSLPEGLSGLLIAALLAAAMSSLSSGINSTATVVSEDLLKRFSLRFFEKRNGLDKIRILSYLIGVVVMVLSLYVGQVEGNLIDIANKIVNLFVAPIFVLFFMAFFIPFAQPRATFIAGLISIATGVAIAFFGFMNITVLWILPMSLFSGVIAGIALSWLEKSLLPSR